MSGGYFDYEQYKISQIAEKIRHIIYQQKNYNYDYNEETIAKLKEGLISLNRAFVYANRIDWLICGDDNETSFLQRLNEDLKEYESCSKTFKEMQNSINKEKETLINEILNIVDEVCSYSDYTKIKDIVVEKYNLQ